MLGDSRLVLKWKPRVSTSRRSSTSTACLWRMRHPTSFCLARPRRSARPRKPRRRHFVDGVPATASTRATRGSWRTGAGSASRGACSSKIVSRRARDDRRPRVAGHQAALAERSTDAIVASLRPPAARRTCGGSACGACATRPIHDGQALAFGERAAGRTAPPCATPSTASSTASSAAFRYDYVVYAFVSITKAMARYFAEDGIEGGDTHDIHFAANYDGSWRFISLSQRRLRDFRREATARQCSPTRPAVASSSTTTPSRVRRDVRRAPPPALPRRAAPARRARRHQRRRALPGLGRRRRLLRVEAITRGIRVRASAVYLPNSPSATRSIHIRRVSTTRKRQLRKTRHSDGERTSTVSGEGVVGKFPVLTSQDGATTRRSRT